MEGYTYAIAMGNLPNKTSPHEKAERKRGFTIMKNRIIRSVAMLAILCVMVMLAAVPLASAASYMDVYGQTQDRIRVRESASTNATIVDNIIKNACVYVTDSKTSGNSTFVRIKYRNADGDIATGWACQYDGKTTYVKILSDDQVYKTFGVKHKKSGDYNLPSKKVGTFTASERKASANDSNSSYIKLNSSGAAVKSMQQKLKKLGYYTATETGNAGPKTIEAVKKFQSANGLTADGVAGPATLAKIDAAYDKLGTSSSGSSASGSGLRLNSTGSDVRDLQDNLTALGYYWATISGNFGPKTETAVKRFQEENGLTVDGIAGKKTLDAIAEAVAKSGKVTATAKDNTSVLKLGSQSSRVGQMQSDLKNLGYYTGEVTKHFGEKTETAVKKFQAAKGLTADGVAGPKTLEAIDKALGSGSSSSSSGTSGLKYGSTGDKVKDLQNDLTTLGYYYGDVTGHYGSLTEQAVKKFQKSRGLTQDGVAGSKTLTAIASAAAGTGSSALSGSNGSGTSLRRGDTNNTKIGDMQTRLKRLGYYYGEITNDFGPLTEKAVKKFQDDNGLTVDGIAGSDTLNKLYSLTGGSSSSTTPGSSSSVALDKSYGRIIKNNVYLRSKASTTSDAKASLGEGTLVRINQKYTTTDNVVWYKITVKNGNYTYTGYVRNDMIESITEAQYNAAGGNSSNNYGDQETLGMIKVTHDKVRLRYSPDTDSEIVGEANKDEVFYYVNSVSGWFQTKSGYWISSSYAKVMTSDEIKDYNGSVSSGNVGSTYRNGSTGSGVLEIQTMLNTLHYYDGKLSGNYGDLTEEAVRVFQKENGLSADGVAGPKTIAAIRAAYTASFGSSDATTSYNEIIYNLSWTKNSPDKTGRQIMENLGLKKRGVFKLTDIKTGLSFNVDIQSFNNNHVDAEPAKASDTSTMCRIYDVSSAAQIPYDRRAMILTVGGEQFLCSIYGEVHGQANVTNNNFVDKFGNYGQFCIHFKDSNINAGDGGNVDPSKNHQAVISNAAKDLNGSTLGGKKVTVSDSYKTSQAK